MKRRARLNYSTEYLPVGQQQTNKKVHREEEDDDEQHNKTNCDWSSAEQTNLNHNQDEENKMQIDENKPLRDQRYIKDNSNKVESVEEIIQRKLQTNPINLIKQGKENQYGNFRSYYDHRYEKKWSDPRLKVLDRNWFLNKEVLDIGCNDGSLTLLIAIKYFPFKIVGIDIDFNLINKAVGNYTLLEKQQAKCKNNNNDNDDNQSSQNQQDNYKKIKDKLSKLPKSYLIDRNKQNEKLEEMFLKKNADDILQSPDHLQIELEKPQDHPNLISNQQNIIINQDNFAQNTLNDQQNLIQSDLMNEQEQKNDEIQKIDYVQKNQELIQAQQDDILKYQDQKAQSDIGKSQSQNENSVKIQEEFQVADQQGDKSQQNQDFGSQTDQNLQDQQEKKTENIKNETDIQNEQLAQEKIPISNQENAQNEEKQNQDLNFPQQIVIKRRFPQNTKFRLENYVESTELTEKYDTICCFSTTKWIHLNFGDQGIKRLFDKVYRSLRVNGIFILEPQEWRSYKKKQSFSEEFRQILKSIKLHPGEFKQHLLENYKFILEKEIMPELNSNKVPAFFKRVVYVFRKVE